GWQHEPRDLDQPLAAGQELAGEEAELGHAEQQQHDDSEDRQQRRQTPPVEAREMLRMATADSGKVDGRPHQCFSSRPIRRWRMREVIVSITATVIRISTRMAETSE